MSTPRVLRSPSAFLGVLPALFPALLLVLSPRPGLAQAGWPEDATGTPRVEVGGGLVVGQPRGEFRDYVSVGFGLDGFARFNLDPSGIVGIRVDAGFLIYGRETQRRCLSSTVGCRIEVEVITSNGIFSGGIGPELALPLGPVVGSVARLTRALAFAAATHEKRRPRERAAYWPR